MSTLLKDCPFCGNQVKIREGHDHSYIGGYSVTLYVECTYCTAQIELQRVFNTAME